MCTLPTAPACLEYAGLGAYVMGTALSRAGARAEGVHVDYVLNRAHAFGYSSGGPVSEAVLGKTFGIGRTPVREALLGAATSLAATRISRATCKEHLKVLDALQTGEPDRVESVMGQHIRLIRAKSLGGVA